MNLTEDSSKKKNPHPSLPAKSPGHNATRPVVALYSRYLYSVSSLFISENIFLSIKWKNEYLGYYAGGSGRDCWRQPECFVLAPIFEWLYSNNSCALSDTKNKILVYLACGTCKMFVVVSTSLNGLHHQPKALQVVVYTSVLVSQMGRGAGINDGWHNCGVPVDT